MNLSWVLKSSLLYRLIQEEKQSTEQRAEELESRVGSVEHMNLLLQQSVGGSSAYSGGTFRSNSTTPLPPTSVPPPLPPSREAQHLNVPPQPPPRSGRLNMPPMPQHLDVVSPPISGRSTPKAHVPNVMPRGQESSFMHKYHTVIIDY